MHIPCSIQIVRTYKVALQQNSLNLKALDERKNRDSITKESGSGFSGPSVEKSNPLTDFLQFFLNTHLLEPTTGLCIFQKKLLIKQIILQKDLLQKKH